MLERLLILVGIVCLGYFAYVTAETALYQAYETRELDAILAGAPEPGPAVATTVEVTPPIERTLPPRAALASGSLLGRLEIPRLHVSAIVRAGSDARTLRLAIGHILGTALPGERGNVGLAAHRDTFFRPLAGIRKGDTVLVTTPDGVHRYRVYATRIVAPTEVSVLRAGHQSQLTLVTCYPFDFVGSAPQRFIVQAELTPPSLVRF